MKGSEYNDSVLVSQDQLRKTDQDKSESIKERFNALITHGILEDGSSPLALTYAGADVITISGGEAYCDFDRTNTSPEYGNTGERTYVPSSLVGLDIKGGTIIGGDPRHFFIAYVEIHKNRKLDEVNVPHYTEKEDSYIIAQLTDSDLTTLTSAGSVYVSDNYVHADQTDLAALTDEELNDTFGSDRWDKTGSFTVDVTVTEFNSVYLGTAQSGPAVSTVYGTRARPAMYIDEKVLNLPDIEDIAQVNHRSKQHSNGISGSTTTFKVTVDGTAVPDELNISDLASDDYGYIGGHRVSAGEIADIYLSNILATNNDYFPDGNTDYYLYVYYDEINTNFKTTAFKEADIPTGLATNGQENYLLIGKVYVDAGRNTIKAYAGDIRYDETLTDNPITDLRKFGTIDSVNISDDGISSIAGNNLLSNGEFEGGLINDTPDEWAGNGVLTTTTVLGGKHSLELASGGVVLSNPIPYSRITAYNLRLTAIADGTTGDYTAGLRGYVGKDWSDIAFADDDVTPINIAYVAPTTVAKTTSWADSEIAVIESGDWSWTTPVSGAYTSADLGKIKYVRAYIRNNSGSILFIDNIKLTQASPLAGIGNSKIGVTGSSTANSGVNGVSIDGDGVNGLSTNLTGVFGSSTSGAGVYGVSTAGVGVNGASTDGVGVGGTSSSSHGVYGTASFDGQHGVVGVNLGTTSSSGFGVYGSSASGYGVYGVSTKTDGVYGTSVDGSGVEGFSASSDGIRGISGILSGVYGSSTSGDAGYFDGSVIISNGVTVTNGVTSTTTAGAGVTGSSVTGVGVGGTSTSSHGVYGTASLGGQHGVVGVNLGATSSGFGIYGSSTSGYGVYGVSTTTNGVYGSSATDDGVKGLATSSDGVYGSSATGNGVRGHVLSGSGNGVYGISLSGSGAGVYGSSASGTGVQGYSTSSYGGTFTGAIASIVLTPTNTTTPSHTALKGSLWVNLAAVLWINTDGGTTWVKVGTQT